MSNSTTIGIDVGGTRTRLAIVDRAGDVVVHRREATDRRCSFDVWLSQLATYVTELCSTVPGAHGDIRVGLAIPGTLDSDRLRVIRCVRLANLEGREPAGALDDRINAHVSLLTDAEAATLGEFSAHSPSSDRFMHLRLGTGIACGLIVGGEPQRLDADRVTHMEALRVDENSDARPCVCGLTGCLEAYASGAALQKQVAELGIGGGLDEVQERWRFGDSVAVSLVSTAARYVAKALEGLTAQFTPDVICLGGGVAKHLPALCDEATTLYIDSHRQSGVKSARITLANRGDHAGVIGAARFVQTDANLPSQPSPHPPGRVNPYKPTT